MYVSTPSEVCEQRDVRGLYQKTRQGIIKGFTGIDNPYEALSSPELVVDTSNGTHEEHTEKVISYLKEKGKIVVR